MWLFFKVKNLKTSSGKYLKKNNCLSRMLYQSILDLEYQLICEDYMLNNYTANVLSFVWDSKSVY